MSKQDDLVNAPTTPDESSAFGAYADLVPQAVASESRYADLIPDQGPGRIQSAASQFAKSVASSEMTALKALPWLMTYSSDPQRRQRDYENHPITRFANEQIGIQDEFYQPNPKYKDEFITSKLPEMAGSTVPAMVLGAVNPLLGMGAYAAQSGVQGGEEALKFNRPDNTDLAFAGYALTGLATEGLLGAMPRMWKLIRQARSVGVDPRSVNATLKQMASLRRVGEEAGQSAVREGVQESLEQALNNAISQQLYDPNRPITEGVGEAALGGAVLGGIMGGGVSGAVSASASMERARRLEAARAFRQSPERQLLLQNQALVNRIMQAGATPPPVVPEVMVPPQVPQVPISQPITTGEPNAISIGQQPIGDQQEYRGTTPEVQIVGKDRQEQAQVPTEGAQAGNSNQPEPGGAVQAGAGQAVVSPVPAEQPAVASQPNPIPEGGVVSEEVQRQRQGQGLQGQEGLQITLSEPGTANPAQTISGPASFSVMTPPSPGIKPVRAEGVWDVVEASDYGFVGKASNLQIRERSKSLQSKEQVNSIAQQNYPELLMESPVTTLGAPVIDKDGKRLAGYGRIEGLRIMYESVPEQATKYRHTLQATADRLGIGEKARGMKQPILVRRVTKYTDGTAEDFARESNRNPQLDKAPAELANQDAQILMSNPDLMGALSIDENGNYNKQFVDAFYNLIQDRTGLKEVDGSYSVKMEERINTAVLALYLVRHAANPSLAVRRAVEQSKDSGMVSVLRGIAGSVSTLLRVENTFPEYSVARDMTTALEDLFEAKQQLKREVITDLADFYDMDDLFRQKPTEGSLLLFKLFADATSAKAVTRALVAFADNAEVEAKKDQTADMFGGVQKKSPTSILKGAIDQYEREQEERARKAAAKRRAKKSGDKEGQALGGSDQGGTGTQGDSQAGESSPGAPLLRKDRLNYELNGDTPAATGKAPYRGTGNDQRYADVLSQPNVTGRSMLEAIASRTQNSFYRMFAQVLLENGVNPKVEYMTRAEAEAKFGDSVDLFDEGAYFPEYDLIVLYKFIRNQELTFLHEMAHSALEHQLRKDEGFRKEVADLLKLARNQPNARDYYGLSDVSEFLSEAWANPEFQEYLKGIKVKSKSLWQRLLDMVRKFFGLKTSEMNLLETVIDLSGPRLSPPDMMEMAEFDDPSSPLKRVADNPQEAKLNIERGVTRDQEEFERVTTASHVGDMLNIIATHSGGDAEALTAIGVENLTGIETVAGRGRMTFDQWLSSTPTSVHSYGGLMTWLQVTLERTRWKQFKKTLQEKRDYIFSDAFLKKLERLDALGFQKRFVKSTWENFKAGLQDEMKSVRDAMQKEAAAGGRTEMMLARLNSLEQYELYESAIEQALTGMAETLSRSPRAAALLMGNPDVAAFVAEYNRTVRELTAAGTPPQNLNEAVVNMAANVYVRNWAEAQNILLSSLVRGNLQMQAEMTDYGRKLYQRFRDDPKKAIGAILESSRANAKREAVAEMAFRKLNKEVMAELEEYNLYERGGTIIDNVEADPNFRSLVNRTAKLGGVEQRPDWTFDLPQGKVQANSLDYSAVAASPILPLPNNSFIQINLSEGDVDKFEAERVKMEYALSVYSEWKEVQDALPEDQRDYAYQFFVNHMKALDNVLMSSRVTHPPSLTEALGYTFDEPVFLIEALNNRLGGPMKVAGAILKRITDLARNLNVDYTFKLTNAKLAAARSYNFPGYDTSGSFGRSLWHKIFKNDADRYWTLYDKVLRPLYAAAQQPGFSLREGMIVGEGYAVTKEVVDLLKLESKAASEGYKIVQERLPNERPGTAFTEMIEDTFTSKSGVSFTYYGRAVKVNETTLPFSGYNKQAEDFASGYKSAKDAKDLSEMDRLLEGNWDLWFSYMDDRSSVVAAGATSPYENAYALVVERVRADRPKLPERNLTWLVSQIAGIVGKPAAEVREVMKQEMDGVLSRFSSQFQESRPSVKVTGPGSKSGFTIRRHDNQLPYWFKNYGFRQSMNWQEFVSNIQSNALERYIVAMEEQLLDLRNRVKPKMEEEYLKRQAELEEAGVSRTVAKRQAIKETIRNQKLENFNGRSFDSFRNLNLRMRQLDRQIKMMKEIHGTGYAEWDVDQTTQRRVTGSIMGNLLAAVPTTVRNAFGLVYLGAYFSKLKQSGLATNFTVGLTLAGWGLVKAGLAVPMVKLARLATKPTPLSKYFQALEDRMDQTRRLEEAGLVQPLHLTEELKAKAQLLVTGGYLSETDYNVGSRTALGLVSMLDTYMYTPLLKGWLPRIGDKITNETVSAQTESWLRELERHFKTVYLEWQEAGTLDSRWNFSDRNDPKNRLSDEELFPVHWKVWANTMSSTSMRQKAAILRKTFEWSDMTIDQAAWAFFQKLRAGEADPRLVTPDMMVSLKGKNLSVLNTADILNTPLWTQKRSFLNQLFAPLMRWNVNALRQFMSYLSVGTETPDQKRMLLWGVMLLTVVPQILLLGGATDLGAEEIIRAIYRLFGKERATRQPWEAADDAEMFRLAVISMLNPIPFVNVISNTALTDQPKKASFDITPVAIGKLRDLVTYAGGVIRTKDITYGADRVVGSFFPIVDMVLNNALVDGTQEALNVRRMLTRYGEVDLLKPKTGAMTGTLSELTPYGPKMLNAAMHEDMGEFRAIYAEAVEVATRLGKENPEQTVKNMFLGMNPYDRAFKRKLTPEQYQALMSRMSDRERAEVQEVERKFEAAAAEIGATATYQKTESMGGGRASSPVGSPRTSRTGANPVVTPSGASGASQGNSVARGGIGGGSMGATSLRRVATPMSGSLRRRIGRPRGIRRGGPRRVTALRRGGKSRTGLRSLRSIRSGASSLRRRSRLA